MLVWNVDGRRIIEADWARLPHCCGGQAACGNQPSRSLDWGWCQANTQSQSAWTDTQRDWAAQGWSWGEAPVLFMLKRLKRTFWGCVKTCGDSQKEAQEGFGFVFLSVTHMKSWHYASNNQKQRVVKFGKHHWAIQPVTFYWAQTRLKCALNPLFPRHSYILAVGDYNFKQERLRKAELLCSLSATLGHDSIFRTHRLILEI